MKSKTLGSDTSAPEVTHVSRHGLWLLLDDREFFLPFSEFPWFKEAPVAMIFNVERLSPYHVRWPDLDVDLSVASIEHPERFPLVAKSAPAEEPKTPRR